MKLEIGYCDSAPMENLITRYRNISVLVAVLFVQVLALGIQIKRPGESNSTRLIRLWAVEAITPFERVVVRLQNGCSTLWHEYFYLRGVRQENRGLKQEIERLRLEQVRLTNDAEQSRRLKALIGFKEQFISQTVAAEVIGSSGTEHSRVIYIDKGARDGIKANMPVITADGVIGKILTAYGRTAQVLLIDDQTSGVGTILEQSRLQGILKGTAAGDIILDKVMNDEQVQQGERILTSGGDQVFPKGLFIGTVAKASHGPDSFLSIKVKPAADLGRLEEVLVITQKQEQPNELANSNSRAADILAQRLPSVPDKPAIAPAQNGDHAAGEVEQAPVSSSGATAASSAIESQAAGSEKPGSEKTESEKSSASKTAVEAASGKRNSAGSSSIPGPVKSSPTDAQPQQPPQ